MATPESTPVLRVLQSKDETRAFYNKIAAVYDLLSEHSEGPVRDAGLELLAIQPGERVLEIGYGTGHSLVTIAQAVGETGKIFGIDLSEGMRTHAQALLLREDLLSRVELTCGDATRLPWPDSSMDAVFMSFTLELFDNPEIPLVLAECKRVLRVGGRVGVVSMSKEGEGVAVEAFEWTHRHFPNLLDCRPIYARRAVEEASFKVRECRKMDMWTPVELVVGEKS
jgi:ubiquinone/menaquinone biosynthesis C-methylase UbiE